MPCFVLMRALPPSSLISARNQLASPFNSPRLHSINSPHLHSVESELSLSGQSLSTQPQSDPIQFGIDCIDSALPGKGLPRGAIHEFFYNDPLDPYATATTLPALLAYNSHAALVAHSRHSLWRSPLAALPRILWIGKRSWPAPPALAALTAPDHSVLESLFAHSLFIDTPNDTATLWAIDLALRSAAVDLIVATCPRISRTTTQRLSLAAHKHTTTAILLRSYSDREIPSCAASRWALAPTLAPGETPAWQLSLLKLRAGLLMRGEWIARLSTPDLFCRPSHPLSVTPLSPPSAADHHSADDVAAETRYKRALS